MRLYLLRHGQTDWNRSRRLQGRTDVQLNEWGRKVAKLTREGLEGVQFNLAFTSPLSRAKETAEIVLGDRGVPVIEEPRMIEVNFGGYEGKDFDLDDENLQYFFSKPECYRSVDGSEPMQDIMDRVGEFYEELIANPMYQESTILVSTHGAALSALLCHIKGWHVRDLWKGGLHKNCGISIVDVTDGKAVILEEAIIVYDEGRVNL